MSGYELVEATDDAAWDAAVQSTEQGTIFGMSAYLRSLAMPVKRWWVKSGKVTVGLIPVVEDDTGQRVVQPPYTAYLGPMFVHDAKALRRDRVLDEYRVSEFLVAELTNRYRDVAMALSWHCKDVRAFLWHNYHEADKPHFSVVPRYTALIDLRDFNAETFLADLRRARKRELKTAQDHVISDSTDIELFMRLYADTFGRQDITLPEDHLLLVRRITADALAGGYGRLSACTTPQGVGSMNVFLYDQRRAYSLFAGNAPDLRDSGSVTRLLVDNVLHAHQRGLQELDMLGVNSPARGDWKLSFNPELTPYFAVNLTSPAA
jgi:hypothetical protein